MATKQETLDEAQYGRGCLGKAYNDEVVFVLRAKDIMAPEVVEIWAGLTQRFGGPGSADKAEEARVVVREMRAWQQRNQNLVKVAD